MIRHQLYQQPTAGGEYRFWQQAWFVKDIVAAAQKWVNVYGVGPFHVLPKRRASANYRGEIVEIEMQTAVAQAGPVQIELVYQGDEQPSIYRDFLRGYGPHHICTLSYDYERSSSHYRELGYPLAMELQVPGYRVGYFDTTADFGLMTEVVEATPGFIGSLEAIAHTCAHWDGTDPVRFLRRNGYTTPDGREVLQ